MRPLQIGWYYVCGGALSVQSSYAQQAAPPPANDDAFFEDSDIARSNERLVEADLTKPRIGETKIQLLLG
jgi:hypothetical protein